jgi:hypothetical protein
VKVRQSKRAVRIAAIALVASLAVGGLALTGGPASAETTTPPGPTTRAAQAPMRLECGSPSTSPARDANEDGSCAPRSGVTPMDTVTGDCGDSAIDVIPIGFGNAAFFYILKSTEGLIDYRNVTIEWVNKRTGETAKVQDKGIVFPPLPEFKWSPVPPSHTGTGDVMATLTGKVSHWDGLECTILNPTSTQTIF